MKNSTMLLFLGSYFFTFFSNSRAENSATQPSELGNVIKLMMADQLRSDFLGLVNTGLKLVESSPRPSLDEDIAFLTLVAEQGSKRNGYEQELHRIMKALDDKYKDAPHSRIRLLIQEAAIFRNQFENTEKEGELLEQAKNEMELIQLEESVTRLNLLMQLGNSYLVQSDADKHWENRKKAYEYYRQILRFPIFDRLYAKKFNELKNIYTDAALRVVEMTPSGGLSKLHLYPFVFESVEQMYPDRIQRISRVDPDLAEFKSNVSRWLEGVMKDQPKDSPLRQHMQGVVEYLRNGAEK